MTAGSPSLLVLGVGNLLLGDDGAGLAQLTYLSRERTLVILDAVALGSRPARST